jgi:hypothetical protein
LIALLTGGLLIAGNSLTVGAGEVPSSALASALQTAPELVDSPALVFLYPQRVVDGPSRIVSFAGGEGAGVILAREGRLGVTALAQSIRVLPGYYSDARVLQTGLAGAIGAFRIGAAYRDQRSKRDDVNHDLNLTTGQEDRRESHSRQSTQEFAAGVGLARGRGSVALAAELTRFDRHADGVQSEDTDDVTYSTQVLGERRWGGTFLVAAPLGQSNLVRVAGAFRDRRSHLHAVRHDLMYQSFDYQNPLYGHDWNAGLAFEHDLGASRSWRLHGFYSDSRDPGQPSANSYSSTLDVDATRQEFAEVGASFQRPGWWGETQYFGARAYLTKITGEGTSFYRDRLQRSTSFDEHIYHAFSWGASRSFGDLDLVGQVATDLSAADIFGSVDASLRF